jgi:hypothetical protein
LAQHRRTARICVLYKAHNGEGVWKDIGDRLQASYYRSRVDHFWKIRSRKLEQMLGKSLTGIGYLKGRLRLPSLKRMYSERGLGNISMR